ncbi:MAG: T9SS type A sorting domain-containing protein [Saprospiraceae bacterium]|nr:T9SS type A sorting domain-containing protein [Saprospiraceae bacterium]
MKYIFTILLFVVSFLQARACTCAPIRTFCESVRPHNPVLLGVVTRHYIAGAHLMDVRVLEWLKPLGIPLNNITIISGGGGDCRYGTGNFAIGDTLILAPDQDHRSYINAAHSTFSLFDCAVSFMRVRNGIVQGTIREGLNSAPLAAIHAELGMCIDNIGPDGLKLFPNPTNVHFDIVLPGIVTPDRVRFYNTLGQEVFLEMNFNTTERRIRVNTDALRAGVYFVVLQYGSYRRTLKWVKA